MKRKYFGVIDEGMVRISSYDYIDNGDFWECEDMNGKYLSPDYVIYIEDNEPHYLPTNATGSPVVVEIDVDALPEELKKLLQEE